MWEAQRKPNYWRNRGAKLLKLNVTVNANFWSLGSFNREECLNFGRKNLVQVDSDKYPWIAQLVVRDLWYHEEAIFASSCSAVLVSPPYTLIQASG